MKKYIYTTIVSIGIFSLTTVSCSDEFVNREPKYSIDSENYFNSKTDYDNALVAAYDMLQSSYINVLMGEIASDNTLCGGESATDVPGFQQIDDMTHTPVNDNLKNLWDWMFAGVQRANYILEFKDKTDFEGKAQIIAETRFLRAYYHFELVKWFGGIPMNGDKRFEPGDETTVKRSSVQEVYASIEADLIYASQNLSPTAAQAGRVTKGAALSLLGKAYLYQNKFPEAAAALEQVITSSKYSLVSDYASIFEMEGENGNESIFEVQYTDVKGASFTCLQCVDGNVAVGFSGIRGYELADGKPGPKYTSGFSFNVPTKETYNSFEVGDSRLDASLLDIVAWSADNNTVYGKGYEHTGYYNQKYLPRLRSSDAQSDLNLTNPNNYRAIRYADVLLMAAEAQNRAGNDTKALDYLNQVRDRGFGDTNHRLSSAGTALRDAILKERRSELVGEGFRFFDLVRTGKAAGTIPGFVAGKHELFPIPLQEIQFSNGNWNQNPGY